MSVRTPTSLPLDAITVGERDRADMGNIKTLAESIAEVGLLHPLPVTADHVLVAGGRRLEAVRSLGWTQVPVTVVDLSTVEQVLRAEADENTCRKNLSPREAAEARKRRVRVLAPEAKQRKGGRPKKDEETSPNLGEVSRKSREVSKAAAVGTGYSGTSLDKVDEIALIAESGVTKSGQAVPEQVAEVAKQALDDLGEEGALIEPAVRKVSKALARYVEEDPDIKRQKYMKRVHDELKPLTKIPVKFDAQTVADNADEEFMRDLDISADGFNQWVSKVKKARPKGLRVVGGSK